MQTKLILMKQIRYLIAAALILVTPSPGFAADPIYPAAVRVGMVPLVGMVPAKVFSGFESEDGNAKVLVAELPSDAYGEVKNAFTNGGTAGTGGIKPDSVETAGAGVAYYTVENNKSPAGNVRRYSMIVSGGTFSGYVAVQIPENATKIYSDDAVRQMFASAVIRKEVPVDEQLGLMPFKVTELGDFKNVRSLAPGAALVLADNDETAGFETGPFMVLGLMSSAPSQPEDRARFAQQSATSIPGVRDARITMSEPVRIDGVAGFETRIDAVSGKDDTPVTVVQWLRFGGPNSLRIIGSSPRDQWTKAFPRFRTVRDGIQPR
jgi:hypothetical protein